MSTTRRRFLATTAASGLTVLGGGLLIWGGSALFVEPASDAAARDPLLPLLFGTLSLALGVVWMGAAFQKRGNAA